MTSQEKGGGQMLQGSGPITKKITKKTRPNITRGIVSKTSWEENFSTGI
jgi:hypothetical protein